MSHGGRRARLLALAATLIAGAGVLVPAGASGEATPAPLRPANDNRVDAQPVHSLPATVEGTTVGATTEPGEAESACNVPTDDSVWYSLRLTTAHRVAIDLAAADALDATVDVYHAVRSQLVPVGCGQTESRGKTSLSFEAAKNGLYDIRVAALQNSQLASFTLEVFLPTPAVAPPGPPLPAAGVSGQVDRIQNINAAYSVVMHSGVSYLINLANDTEGGCVSGALFSPGTSSFGGEEGGEQTPALVHIHCGGFRLFTPGPGEGGRYSFEITPRLSRSGIQRFHLQVAPAGVAETAPGLPLGNYAHVHGYLDGNDVRVLRLYRMVVTSHSNLSLQLSAPANAEFSLQLRDEHGNVVECACDGSGDQTLQSQLRPGTYYAVVSERNHSVGSFSLTRESRTITTTKLSFSSSNVTLGGAVGIDVRITPDEAGPVTVEIERFAPVFGWQFYRDVKASASSGLASVYFAPPAVGLWRAQASYEGSAVASPSGVGYSYLTVG